MMGDARSELFHYEVRITYDTPEVADNRRIVEEAHARIPSCPTNRRTTSHGGNAGRNEALLRPVRGRSHVGVARWATCSPGRATVSIPANVTVQVADTSGFRGYVKGSADAPVEITEYADYQCPFCQTFATLQMPTIEERLIKTGRLRWRYRDFPLQQHPFARLAAHSAACADEQGKYWEQHRPDLRGPGGVGRAPEMRRRVSKVRRGRRTGSQPL